MPQIDLTALFLFIMYISLFVFLVIAGVVVAMTLFRWRDREERSVDSVLLEIVVPKTTKRSKVKKPYGKLPIRAINKKTTAMLVAIFLLILCLFFIAIQS